MTAVQTRNTVSYSLEAKAYLYHLPEPIANYIRRSIATLSQEPLVSRQMCVTSWTINLPDHIYRAMKLYAYSPGYRVIFHRESGCVVAIDRIARRDCDPYLDGK
jgi:hypothetical protein